MRDPKKKKAEGNSISVMTKPFRYLFFTKAQLSRMERNRNRIRFITATQTIPHGMCLPGVGGRHLEIRSCSRLPPSGKGVSEMFDCAEGTGLQGWTQISVVGAAMARGSDTI